MWKEVYTIKIIVKNNRNPGVEECNEWNFKKQCGVSTTDLIKKKEESKNPKEKWFEITHTAQSNL